MGRGKRLPMHFGHAPGPVGLTITAGEDFVLTCGADEVIRTHSIATNVKKDKTWWEENPNDAPDAVELPASTIHDVAICDHCVAPGGRTLATAAADGFVRLFSIKVDEEEGKGKKVVGELIQSCARFGGPVRALAFSPTGAFLAAAGDEPGVVKIVTTCSPGNVRVMRGEGVGGDMISYVCYDPNNDFIATIGQNGVAGVWGIEKGQFVKSIEAGKRKVKSLTWAPDGSQLVVGTDDGAVIVGRDSWMFEHKLEDLGNDDDPDDDDDDDIGLRINKEGEKLVTAVAWSSNGKYVLTGTDAGAIVLWDVQTRTIISKWKIEAGAQRLMWHPSRNALIACDTLGQWGIIGPAVPSHMPLPKGEAAKKVSGVDDLLKGFESDDDGPKVLRRSKKEGSGDDEEDRVGEEGYENSIGDADADAEEEDLSAEAALDLSGIGVDEEDIGPTSNSQVRSDVESGRSLEGRRERRRKKKSKSKVISASLLSGAVAQKSFQPSSTPSDPNQKKRILCWNLAGVVTSQDEHVHNTISIDFADSSVRPVRIRDHYQYTMSSLTSTGVLLACPTASDHPSHIYFRPFQSWSNNSDWTLTLEEDECATGIVLSSRFAAVATSKHLIRVLSMTGVQTDVLSIPGRVVTLAADGHLLSYVYSSNERSSELLYSCLELNSWNEVEKILSPEGHLPLSPSSSLKWYGYTSETAALVSYDSHGTLRVKYGPRWVPMLTKAHEICSCNVFWLAAVTTSAAVGISCLSNETHPSASTRPALRTVPFVAPIIIKGESAVSERLYRSRIREWRLTAGKEEDDDSDSDESLERAQMEVEKCLLFMVEEACRAGKGTRALDFVARLRSPVGFEQASRVANHYRMQALAERVSVVAKAKLAQIQAEEEEKYLVKTQQRTMQPLHSPTRSVSEPEKRVSREQSPLPASKEPKKVAEKHSAILGTISDDDDDDGNDNSHNNESEGERETQNSSQGLKRVMAPKRRSEPPSKKRKTSAKQRKVQARQKERPSTQVSNIAISAKSKKSKGLRRNPFAIRAGSQATQTSRVK